MVELVSNYLYTRCKISNVQKPHHLHVYNRNIQKLFKEEKDPWKYYTYFVFMIL